MVVATNNKMVMCPFNFLNSLLALEFQCSRCLLWPFSQFRHQVASNPWVGACWGHMRLAELVFSPCSWNFKLILDKGLRANNEYLSSIVPYNNHVIETTFWDWGRAMGRKVSGRGQVFVPLKVQHMIWIRLTLSVRIIKC